MNRSEAIFELLKVVRTRGGFNILTSKYTLRYNGMYFFDISTSKSGANMWYFVYIDF